MVSVVCWALLLTSYSASTNSQTVDPTTGNLITGTWSGTTPVSGYGGFSGGGTPGYISNQKAIVFGYSQSTVNQSIGIASALANAGTGIEVKGYNYSWYYYNNGDNRGNLSGTISLKGAAGSVLESYNYNMPDVGIGNWIQQSGRQNFTNQYQISQLSTLDVSFTGKDDRFWAGYYGPAIKSINVNLAYGVNPCATNPAYSPNCAGFDKVLTSSNLVPNPDGYAVFGSSINQSYAINTALSAAGSAAQIHGFNWGYVANANGPYCNSWDLGIFGCLDQRNPSVTTNVNITNSAGASLYNVSRNYTNSYNTTNYSYLFPTSQTMSTLGNFNFSASTYDQAYVGSMYSRAIYTVDPCAANPLYSPTCSGYGAAFAKTLTSSTTSTTTAYAGTTSVTSSSQVETSPAGVIDQTSPATSQQTSSSTSTVSSSTSTSTPQESTQTAAAPTADPAQPAATGAPAPAGGPAQTTATASSSSSSSSSSPSSAGPSKLAMSVLKSAQDKDKATQTAAVQSAAKTLENATQSSQASSNAAITMNQDMSANSATAAANFASQTTQASMQVNQMSQQGPQSTVQVASYQSQTARTSVSTQQTASFSQQTFDTSTTSAVAIKAPTLQIDTAVQASSGMGISIGRSSSVGFNLYSLSNSANSQTVQQSAPTFQYRTESRPIEVEAPQVQVASFGGAGRAGNPLSNMMQQRFELMQENTQPQTSSVNRNVQTNELAGGVDLASMSVVPAGFSAYSFTLKDTAFYEPKEIYRNQKVVDNVRALRQMSSDSLHKQMVDSQYKVGN